MPLMSTLARHWSTLPAGLALMILGACVDPSASPSSQNLPKPDENVYVASMDGEIAIPALPQEEIPETYRRQVVAYETDQEPGTIIINPKTRLLYYVIGKNKAIRYGISVGRAGFEWSGTADVVEKKQWPTWTPPKEMIERDPKLAKWEKGQPGGPTNPLGARAIYLKSGGIDYGYRIHGTPEWRSIGRNASSGCIRMINQDVIDLYDRLQGGEKVIVLTAAGEMPKGLFIPKPPAPKKKEGVVPANAVPPLKVLPQPTIALPTAAPTPAAGPAPVSSAPVVPAPVVPAPAAEAQAAPAAAPAPAAPAAAPAKPALPPPAFSVTCAVPLVNGVCPPGMESN